MNPEEIINSFNEHRTALNMSARTIQDDTVYLWKFFGFLDEVGIDKVTDVNESVLLEYQIYVAGLKNKKGNPYEPQTRKHHLSVVGSLYRYLWLKGEVFYNPVAKIERIKVPKKLPQDILSVEEVKTLMEQPDNTWLGIRNLACMHVLYSTAMRRCELLKLDLLDLHHDRKTIHIREGKYRKDRVVPCGRSAWKWLNKYLEDIRPLRVADPNEQAVFISRKGGRLGKQGLKSMLDKCGKQAGIARNVTPHTLRHSSATHMHDNGADIRRLQELLGHESIETTARYLRVSIVKLKQVHKDCHPFERAKENVA